MEADAELLALVSAEGAVAAGTEGGVEASAELQALASAEGTMEARADDEPLVSRVWALIPLQHGSGLVRLNGTCA